MKELLNADPVAIRAFVREKFQKLIEEFESFVQNGSGWAVESVEYLYMAVDQYRPGRGGSHMESPTWIVAKRCCVNVQNLNNDCFRYALTAAIDKPANHADRPTHYDRAEKRALFDLTGIVMPAKCSSLTYQRFEKQNPKYSLLVYQCPQKSQDRGDLFPAYISPHEGPGINGVVDREMV